MTTLPPIFAHGNAVGASTSGTAPYSDSIHEVLAKSFPPLTALSDKTVFISSESTLDGFNEDNDDYSVSSCGSEVSSGSENSFDFMSGKGKSKRCKKTLDNAASFSSPDCGGRQISPMKMFSGASAKSHLSNVLSNITYENGRRQSLTDASASSNSDLHRQIEADLLQHRNLVALKGGGSKFTNIARIHIEVDSKVASAMAARTFVDTSKIEVHQRRSSIDGFPNERHRSSSTERRGSGSHASLTKLPAAPLSLPPVSSTLRRGSGEVPTSGDTSSPVLDPLQRSQLRRAGRVVAASRRLLMGGMQDQVVGTVECLASDRTTFRQPRFAQATVGSLMAIKA